MKKVGILVFFVFLSGVIATEEATHHAELSSRIVGGSIAPESEFAFQASLRNANGHICGAVVISKDWLVTACQCVNRYHPSQLNVVVGTKDLNRNGILHRVSYAKCHESFISSKIPRNDIALLKVVIPLTISDKVKPIPLETAEIRENVTVLVSGWGSNFPNGPFQEKLVYAQLRTISNLECQQRSYPDGIMNNELCTFTTRGQGTCRGDAGGALVAHGYLVGLVSWGRACAIGYPDVHTRISSHVPWIYKNIA